MFFLTWNRFMIILTFPKNVILYFHIAIPLDIGNKLALLGWVLNKSFFSLLFSSACLLTDFNFSWVTLVSDSGQLQVNYFLKNLFGWLL